MVVAGHLEGKAGRSLDPTLRNRPSRRGNTKIIRAEASTAADRTGQRSTCSSLSSLLAAEDPILDDPCQAHLAAVAAEHIVAGRPVEVPFPVDLCQVRPAAVAAEHIVAGRPVEVPILDDPCQARPAAVAAEHTEAGRPVEVPIRDDLRQARLAAVAAEAAAGRPAADRMAVLLVTDATAAK